MNWSAPPPPRPLPRGVRTAIVAVAVPAAVVIAVHSWRAGMRDADDTTPAESCAAVVRAVSPAIADAHASGLKTTDLQAASRLIVSRPDCFPQRIRDHARGFLDETATPSR